ncbi:Alpha/Beta hydrolase protein [Abortiporus biennis]|nr:Alpha/Beta hydrolase protein [Abortiporus biennis]
MSQYAHLSARDEQLEAALKLLPPKVEIKGDANDVRKAFKERFFAALKRNPGTSQQAQDPDSEGSILTFLELSPGGLPYVMAHYIVRTYSRHDEAKFTVEDKSVPVSDSVNIRARITTPTSGDANATYPLLFWMHGGGFFLGSPEMDDSLRPTVAKLQVVLISVDYRSAFVSTALENAAALKIDPSKGVLVGGASSELEMTLSLSNQDFPLPAKSFVCRVLFILGLIFQRNIRKNYSRWSRTKMCRY